MNLDDRVRSFLVNWPIVEKRLNEILQEAIRDGNKPVDDGCRGCEVSPACRDHRLPLSRE